MNKIPFKKIALSILILSLFSIPVYYVAQKQKTPKNNAPNGTTITEDKRLTLGQAIDQLTQKYDHIIFDTPTLVVKEKITDEDRYKFENKIFTVEYPVNKQAYGDDSFHLCDYKRCQDDEMSIYYKEGGDLASWLLGEEWITLETIKKELRDEYKIKIFPSMKLKQYLGVGYQVIKKTPSDDRMIISLDFQTEKGILYGYLDFNNQTHQNIWASVQLK